MTIGPIFTKDEVSSTFSTRTSTSDRFLRLDICLRWRGFRRNIVYFTWRCLWVLLQLISLLACNTTTKADSKALKMASISFILAMPTEFLSLSIWSIFSFSNFFSCREPKELFYRRRFLANFLPNNGSECSELCFLLISSLFLDVLPGTLPFPLVYVGRCFYSFWMWKPLQLSPFAFSLLYVVNVEQGKTARHRETYCSMRIYCRSLFANDSKKSYTKHFTQ